MFIEDKPTIQNTLYSHFKLGGWLTSFAKHAEDLGYPFFEWNGMVKNTKTGKEIMKYSELFNVNIQSFFQK